MGISVEIIWYFILFSLHKPNFMYFCLAIPGEIGAARESAFFALFLTSEPRHFTIC